MAFVTSFGTDLLKPEPGFGFQDKNQDTYLNSTYGENKLAMKDPFDAMIFLKNQSRLVLFFVIYAIWLIYMPVESLLLQGWDSQAFLLLILSGVLLILLILSGVIIYFKPVYAPVIISSLVLIYIVATTLACSLNIDLENEKLWANYALIYISVYVLQVIYPITLIFNFKIHLWTVIIYCLVGFLTPILFGFDKTICMIILFWHVVIAVIIIIPTYKLDIAMSKHSKMTPYMSVDPVNEPVAPSAPPVFNFGGPKKEDKMDRIINRIKEVISKLKQTMAQIQGAAKLSIVQQTVELEKICCKLLNTKDVYEMWMSESDEEEDQDDKIMPQNGLTTPVPGNENNIMSPFDKILQNKNIQPNDVTTIHSYLQDVGMKWNNYPWTLSSLVSNPLSMISLHCTRKYCSDLFFKINPEKIQYFFGDLEKQYNKVPFHNSTHACDVLESFFYLMNNTMDRLRFSPIDTLACIIACAGNSVGHMGLKNKFLVRTRNETALRYNDISVLENMSASIISGLLLSTERNFVEQFRQAEINKLRKFVIQMIIASDVDNYFKTFSEFRRKILSQDLIYPKRLSKRKQDAENLLWSKIFLYAADMAYVAKSKQIIQKWSDCLMEEMYNQGDMEKRNNMQVTNFWDRDDPNVPNYLVKFMTTIGLPMYEKIQLYFQSQSIKEWMLKVQKNIRRYERLCLRQSPRYTRKGLDHRMSQDSLRLDSSCEIFEETKISTEVSQFKKRQRVRTEVVRSTYSRVEDSFISQDDSEKNFK